MGVVVRRLWLLSVLALGLPLMWSSTVWSADVFVAPNGSDSAAGTLAAPLATFAAAIRKAGPGDTVYLRGGVYRQTLAPARSGLPGSPITFSRYGAETVVIDAEGLSQGVILWDVSYIVVRGLQIRHAQRAGIHIHRHLDQPSKGADYNVIENNIVSDGASNGIFVAGYHNRIVNNTVTRNGTAQPAPVGHGIYLLGIDNLVAGNRVQGNQRLGIRLAGEQQQVLNNWVEGNGSHGIGVWVDPPYKGTNIVLDGNQVFQNGGDGIHVSAKGEGQKPQDVRVSNNWIRGDNGAAVVVNAGVSNLLLTANRMTGNFRYFLQLEQGADFPLESHSNHYEGKGSFFFDGRDYRSLDAFSQGTGFDRNSTYSATER